MGIETAIGAGLGLIGSIGSRNASKRAASSASAASNAAVAEERRQFDTALGLQRPAIDAGNTARNQLLSLLGIGGDSSSAIEQIQNTPGFQFQLEQGARALNTDRSAGLRSGGGLIKDFARFNQGTASNFYTDYANRLANIAGTGQTAGQSAGNQAIQSGRGISNSLQNAGQFRASGILGSNNALQDFLNPLATSIGQGDFNGLFKRRPGSSVNFGGGGGALDVSHLLRGIGR